MSLCPDCGLPFGMNDDEVLSAALSRPRLPPGFARWRVTLEPGAQRATTAAEWAGALVLVEHGALEVECEAGGRHRFGPGDLVALGWLPLSRLRNPGRVVTRLVAVRRRGDVPRRGFLRVLRQGEQ